jgi:hypothetical protein
MMLNIKQPITVGNRVECYLIGGKQNLAHHLVSPMRRWRRADNISLRLFRKNHLPVKDLGVNGEV